jgi:hypothetical protein
MKTINFFTIIIMMSLAIRAPAQISINVNIGTPPLWGPVGYNEVQYYYLPDVEAYYDVHTSNFIYYNAGTWVHRTYLPVQYRNYDLYSGYKVVMTDYRGKTPYTHFADYKRKYAKGYRGHAQKTIGVRPGRGTPNHLEYRNEPVKRSIQHENGKKAGNGNGKNNKKSRGEQGGNGRKK